MYNGIIGMLVVPTAAGPVQKMEVGGEQDTARDHKHVDDEVNIHR